MECSLRPNACINEIFIKYKCVHFLCSRITSCLKSRLVRCLPFFFLCVAVYDRMRADQKKFGKAAWAAAVERMEKLQYAVSKETLQLMRAKEICLEQKKHALKEEVSFHASK